MAKVSTCLMVGLAAIGMAVAPGVRAQGQQQGAPAAKAPSGPAPSHDISGVWNTTGRANPGNSWTKTPAPLTQWGQDKLKEAKSSNGGQYTLDQTNDPVISKCFPPGTPRIFMQPFPFQIVQTPTEVIILYEYDHTVRHIALDQPVPKNDDLDPTYMGTSVGKWLDDTTLQVDTLGFNEKTWLDRVGTPHSDQLHVVEKFHRLDKDLMDIDVSMTDSKALSQTWGGTMHFRIHPDWHVMEQVCTDNDAFLSFEKAEDKGGK